MGFVLEINFSIGEFSAGIVYLVVAVQLLRRSLRSGGAPERLLGGAFFFYGVSSVVYTMATLPQFQSMAISINFAGRILYFPVSIFVVVFTRRAFRKKERWATPLMWAGPVLFAAGIVGSIVFRNDWQGFSVGSPWFTVEWVGFTLPFAWAGTEAFIQYSQARRRLQLGLCDPILCNRFLLWGLFGTFQVCAYLVLFPQYMYYGTEGTITIFWDLVYGGLLAASGVVVCLAFFRPAFYARWISRRVAAVDTVET